MIDRYLAALLGLALAAAGAWTLRAPHPPLTPADAVRRDPANPYRWADLADALQAEGRIDDARRAYDRARQLAPAVPPIWVRDANFHVLLDEPDLALRSAARVLQAVPDYDSVLFASLDHTVPDPARVLAGIGQNRRASRAYLSHLIATGNGPHARIVWAHTVAAGFADTPLTAAYLGALLRDHHCAEAQQDWVRYLGSDRGDDYPARNRLFNAGFEREPTGTALDWRIDPSDQVEVVRDNVSAHEGRYALRIRFAATGNLSYSNIAQTTCVQPGPHRLTAWVKLDGITTNEGLRFAITDHDNPSRLDVRTDSLTGTQDWSEITQPFTVPSGTTRIVVRVLRTPSMKFDNKIQGTAWIDSLRLEAR